MPALDPRGPYVLDVRELGRRPGAMTTVHVVVPAPADLANAVIAIPETSDIELNLMLESVIEGVLVSGTARMRAAGECSRCLDPESLELEVGLQELFRHDDIEVNWQDDEELPTLEGDLLDLEPTLRDAVVLALPLAPVCRTDCLGLCPECGFNRNSDPAHRHDRQDPRWSALAALQDDHDRASGGDHETED